MRRTAIRSAQVVAAAWLLAPAVAAEQPATVEQCYLTVATNRSTPEGIALGRELCDAAFGRSARPLAVLEPKSRTCTEWWFDRNGRYEDVDRYCSLEADGPALWKLACQWKSGDQVTFVRLREVDGSFERVAPLQGRDIGRVYASLAGCVEHKLGAVAP